MANETSKTIVELNFRDRLPRLMAAAEKLGSMSLRVVEDPAEALGLLRKQVIDQARERFPEGSEAAYARLAGVTWPESRIGEFDGPGAAHVVTEITLSGDHGLMDLHHTAAHGDTHGRTQIQ